MVCFVVIATKPSAIWLGNDWNRVVQEPKSEPGILISEIQEPKTEPGISNVWKPGSKTQKEIVYLYWNQEQEPYSGNGKSEKPGTDTFYWNTEIIKKGTNNNYRNQWVHALIPWIENPWFNSSAYVI